MYLQTKRYEREIEEMLRIEKVNKEEKLYYSEKVSTFFK